jgi:hypothetical protein
MICLVTKKKQGIATYVHDHFEMAGGFAMGLRISIDRLLAEEIKSDLLFGYLAEVQRGN